MQVQDFETERLRITDWQVELADLQAREALCASLAALLTPDVVKTLPPSMRLTQRGVAGWISDLEKDAGVQVARLRNGGELVGLLIQARAPSGPAVHIGYLLAEKAWGKGFATEMVRGVIDAALGRGPKQFIGGVSRDNPASASVLKKAGFRIEPTLSSDDTEMFVRDLS